MEIGISSALSEVPLEAAPLAGVGTVRLATPLTSSRDVGAVQKVACTVAQDEVMLHKLILPEVSQRILYGEVHDAPHPRPR